MKGSFRLLNRYAVSCRTASGIDDDGFFVTNWTFELFDRDGAFVESSNGYDTLDEATRAARDAAVKHANRHDELKSER